MKLNGNGHRSPDEIEAEIARTRSDLDQTLSAIESRLTPGQLMDQGLHYLRNSGARTYFTNLGESAKSDPVPLALVGVGVAWLMMSSGRNRTGAWPSYTTFEDDARAQSAGSGPMEGMKERLSDSAHRLSDTASSARDSVTHMGQSARDSATHMGQSARDSITHLGQSAREGMSRVSGSTRDSVSRMAESARERVGRVSESVTRMGESARERMGRMGESARHGAERVRDGAGRVRGGVDHLVREQPLALGAIGLAIGAVMAAMTPRTRHEERWVTGRSDEESGDTSGSGPDGGIRRWAQDSQRTGSEDSASQWASHSGVSRSTDESVTAGAGRSSDRPGSSSRASDRESGSDWTSPTVAGAMTGEKSPAGGGGRSSPGGASGISGASATGGTSGAGSMGSPSGASPASTTSGAAAPGKSPSSGPGMGGIGSGSTGISSSAGAASGSSATSGAGSSPATSSLSALHSDADLPDARGVTINPQRSQSASRVPPEHLGRERLYPGSFGQPVVQPASAQREGAPDGTSGAREGTPGSSSSGPSR